jgi:hypothetical protein
MIDTSTDVTATIMRLITAGATERADHRRGVQVPRTDPHRVRGRTARCSRPSRTPGRAKALSADAPSCGP